MNSIATHTTLKAYDWLQSWDPKILQIDNTPLFGATPAFPWEEFSNQLKNSLRLQELEVYLKEQRWRSEEELLNGFVPPLAPIHFSLAGNEGEICLILSQDALSHLMSSLLTEGREQLRLETSEMREDVSRFIA